MMQTLEILNPIFQNIFWIGLLLVLIVVVQVLLALGKFAQAAVTTMAPLERTVPRIEKIATQTEEISDKVEENINKFNRFLNNVHYFHMITHFFKKKKHKN